MDRFVPELFNTVPVSDLTTLEQIAELVRLSPLLSLISDVEVQLWVVEVVFLSDSSLL